MPKSSLARAKPPETAQSHQNAKTEETMQNAETPGKADQAAE
jgi:hypothetical protein